MKKIPLTRGQFALVDDEDYAFLMQWKWQISKSKKKIYASRSEYLGKIDGKYKNKSIKMHRVINKTTDGFLTDHIDGNGLNNQKLNLRNATNSQNQQNKKMKREGQPYKGIYFRKNRKIWGARIYDGKKRIHLGYFKDKEKAALAYNNAAIKYFGDFSCLNQI